jgi:hypothetical protein
MAVTNAGLVGITSRSTRPGTGRRVERVLKSTCLAPACSRRVNSVVMHVEGMIGAQSVSGASIDRDHGDLPPEERDVETFQRNALDPQSWFAVAEKLAAAATVLLPAAKEYYDPFISAAKSFFDSGEKTAVLTIEHPPDVRAIVLMLAAYAAENLCKGLLVARNKDGVRRSCEDAGSLPTNLMNHDLPKLLDNIRYELQPGDRVLAWRLSRAAVWSARYPVPTGPKKLRQGLDGASAGAWAVFTSEDAHLITDFLMRLKAYCIQEADKENTIVGNDIA